MLRGEDIGGVQRIIIYKKTKKEQKCGTIHLPNTPWGPEVPVRIYLSIYLSIYLATDRPTYLPTYLSIYLSI